MFSQIMSSGILIISAQNWDCENCHCCCAHHCITDNLNKQMTYCFNFVRQFTEFITLLMHAFQILDICTVLQLLIKKKTCQEISGIVSTIDNVLLCSECIRLPFSFWSGLHIQYSSQVSKYYCDMTCPNWLCPKHTHMCRRTCITLRPDSKNQFF